MLIFITSSSYFKIRKIKLSHRKAVVICVKFCLLNAKKPGDKNSCIISLKSIVLFPKLFILTYINLLCKLFIFILLRVKCNYTIAINSHSHIMQKQPRRIFPQYTCTETMIKMIKKYLWREIHELNTLIGSPDCT